ncbi:MAG: ABC transporter permease subunit [Clostridiaceae bacterium]|nr:ABC transporter permease subunit [Clostridiaceae bacterium]
MTDNVQIGQSLVLHNKKKKRNRDGIILLLMALPFVAFVFAFSYVPLFGWVFAFFNYKPGISLSQSSFAGLKYFALMLHDGGDMLRVLRNTLVMSFLGILLAPVPVIFAIMITETRSRHFQKLIQTTTTLPNFVSWIIVFSLAFNIFSSDGLLNNLLTLLNMPKPSTTLLGNEKAVWYFQTALGLWKSTGWNAIIYLAAIAGIDNELYDAASVDGAGRFRRILHITIPGVAPTFVVLLLLSASNVLSVGLDQYLVFYNSMVADRIEVIDYYVYKIGLITNDYSYATAIGIFKTVVSITLLFSINGISKKIRGNSII